MFEYFVNILLLLLCGRIDDILRKASVRHKVTAADVVGNMLPWTDIITACVNCQLVWLRYHKVWWHVYWCALLFANFSNSNNKKPSDRRLGMCGKPNIGSDSVIHNHTVQKIWHPFGRFSDWNCVQSAIHLKNDQKITSIACSAQMKSVLKHYWNRV